MTRASEQSTSDPTAPVAVAPAAEYEPSFAALVDRARALSDRRRILGITGAPGSGKSTLAARLVDALGPRTATLVGMDGFHLANSELHALGIHDRKGAEHTFDAGGYVALLHRLAASGESAEEFVYAPVFDRSLEESIGSAQRVDGSVPLVVTEGNYLLLQSGRWGEVRPLLAECWYVDPGEERRVDWLIARHLRFGRDADQARERSLGSDQRNAEVISASMALADLVVTSR